MRLEMESDECRVIRAARDLLAACDRKELARDIDQGQSIMFERDAAAEKLRQALAILDSE
jgi:hypothetical protein